MASEYDPYSNEQYATFWEILVFNIISDDVEYNYNEMYIDAMSVAFKLDNGETFTRIYQPKRYYYLDLILTTFSARQNMRKSTAPTLMIIYQK